MKPVIGITPSPVRDVQSHGTFERYALSSNYVKAVIAAGGIPLILPPQDDHAATLLDRLDGLLLSGGADVDPSRYGDAVVHPATYDIHPLRDRFELEILASAFARDLPVLGICRGIQVLNVALGGTLVQHVPDVFAPGLSHRQQEAGIAASEPSHRVAFQRGSPFCDIYETAAVEVNSFHHQAIRDLAPDLVAEGATSDGLIEAVSHRERPNVLAVQWHPEMMFERHPEQLQPFLNLVSAASARTLAIA